MSIESFLEGRRTYAIAAASRVALVYLWANGDIGIGTAATGFGVALGGTTLRAGIRGDLTRLARALGKLSPLLIFAGLLLVGCATFGGGTDEAKAAEKAAVLGAAVLIPPPFNLLVPGAWAIVEALGVIFAKPSAPAPPA